MNDKELIEHIDYTTKVINVQDEIQQLRNRVAELEEANKLLEADARRYQKLKGNLYGADFMYGEEEIPVLIFDWNYKVSADLDYTIDLAMENKNDN